MAQTAGSLREGFGFVFVITYGRSGSTVLNRVLNSIPGYLIRGENHNALVNIFRYAESLKSTRSMFPEATTGPDHPWYGAEQIRVKKAANEALDGFVRHVLRPSPGSRVLGFKEIRHSRWQIKDQEFSRYVEFLLRHFPQARIVFNRRGWQAVSRSGWWVNTPEEKVRNMVAHADAQFQAASRAHPKRCFGMVYEEFDGNPDAFRPLFEFLGESFDVNAVQEVLAKRLTHARAV